MKITNAKLIYASDARGVILRADPRLSYLIDNIQGVDAVEVVYGQWVAECKNRYRCSICGFGRNTDTQLGWNFCPNCGAKMDGDTVA